MLAAALCTALFASAAMAVTDDASLREAVKNDGTVTLENNIALDDSQGPLVIKGTTTLDLNGKTLSRESTSSSSSFVIIVDGGTLTVNDSVGNGMIKSSNTNRQCSRVIQIGTSGDTDGNGNGGSVTLNGGTIYAAPDNEGYGIDMMANCDKNLETKQPIEVTLTVNDGAKIEAGFAGIAMWGLGNKLNFNGGEIISKYYAVSGVGNPWQGGSTINISGGTMKSKEDVAIHHPQSGTMTISGGEIAGHDGVQMKSGTLNITGGSISASGIEPQDYDKIGDGSILTGAALSILSQGKSGSGYPGDIIVNISGTPTLTSEQSYAIVEAQSNQGDLKFSGLNISGGTFIGADGKSAIAITNASNENTKITAGTFSTDLSTCPGMDKLTNLPTMARDEDDNYYVVVNATAIAFKTETFELAMNETAVLEVVFTPDNTTEKALTWSSSNEEVAKVDPMTGEITPVAPGTTTITAALADNDSVYASCTVTVTEEEVEPTPPITSDDVKPQPSGSGGGGCSAGFGALALLAALPLLRMRKK